MTADAPAYSGDSSTVIGCSDTSISQVVTFGQNGDTLPIDVWIVATSEVFYGINDDASWLSVSPTFGFSSGEHVVHDLQFDTSGLDMGLYNATVSISALEAENSPCEVAVNARVVGTNIAAATGFTSGVWRTGGEGEWVQQVESSYDGGDAAESGHIDDNQISWVELDLEGPGSLTFFWKVSSEFGHDYARLFIDESPQEWTISGDSGWEEVELAIPEGSHTVKWSYEKDISGSAGVDAAWLDDVRWNPGEVDRDGDGMFDWEEEIAGTDPTNFQSVLQISQIRHLADDDSVVISWNSATDRVYSVEMAPDIGYGFTPIVSYLPATAPLNVYTASVGGVDSACFRVAVSEITSGSDITLLEEYFISDTLPSGWQVIDNAGKGALWTFDNPAARTNDTGGVDGFAIADSDYYEDTSMSTTLVTPSMNCSSLTNITLEFKTDYYSYSGNEIVHVRVVSGSSTQTVWSQSSSYRGPAMEAIDISAEAAGQADVSVQFHYEAFFDWWWQLDDVIVSAVVE